MSTPKVKFWTDDRIADLKRLWFAEKFSATECAEKLGDGCTRNMIIGKIHRISKSSTRFTQEEQTERWRLAASRRALMKPQKPKVEKKRVRVMKIVAKKPLPILAAPAVESLKIKLENLQQFHCRWITNDDMSAAEFCGHEKTDHRYCAHHVYISARGYPKPDDEQETKIPLRDRSQFGRISVAVGATL